MQKISLKSLYQSCLAFLSFLTLAGHEIWLETRNLRTLYSIFLLIIKSELYLLKVIDIGLFFFIVIKYSSTNLTNTFLKYHLTMEFKFELEQIKPPDIF